MFLLPYLRWDGRIQRCYNIFDRELRSGIGMRLWALFFSFAMHLINFLYEIRKPESLFWIRKLKSLSLHKRTKEPKNERTEKSDLAWENWKILSYMRNKKYGRLLYLTDFCPISAQCPQFLPNVPNICPISHMSAQFPQFLPNVVCGQISDFFRYF